MITGASGGLGLEFAKLCAADGYDLVIVAGSEGKLYSRKNELEETMAKNARATMGMLFACASKETTDEEIAGIYARSYR